MKINIFIKKLFLCLFLLSFTHASASMGSISSMLLNKQFNHTTTQAQTTNSFIQKDVSEYSADKIP